MPRLSLPLFLVLALLPLGPLHAQIPTVVLQDVPADVLIGEVFHFKLLFKADPSTTGFGPFVELAVQYQGADCTNLSGPCDGLELIGADAVFANSSVPLTACSAVAATSCSPTQCPGTSSTPSPAGCFFGSPPFPAGFQKSVFLLPFGSFVPGQPDVEIDVAVRVHAFADIGQPLQILARGGFRYGGNVLGGSPVVGPPAVPALVTPHVFTLEKIYLGPENETATGPNFPRKYRIEVNVADGQSLSNLEIDDCLPGNLTFLGLDLANTTPGAVLQTLPPPCFNVSFGSVTGVAGGPEIVETFDFFVPRLDASSQEVLGSSCTALSTDQATVTADLTPPQDPRDQPPISDSVSGTHKLTDKCLALQKSARLVSDPDNQGLTPGDVLEYTLDFQVSDFRTIRNLVIDDYLSDGQTLVGIPTLVIRDKFGGPFTGPFPGAFFNQTVVPSAPCQSADPTINPQRLRFQVSALLAVFNPTHPRHLSGVLTGGQAGSPAGGGATGQITFRARVDDQYLRQPSALEPFVDKADPLLNCATAQAQVLKNVNAPFVPTAVVGTAADSSALELRIVVGRLDKTVFAINGNTTVPASPKVQPGDEITFRITYPIPSSDAEQLKVEDFSPLPVLPVAPSFSFSACGPVSPPPVDTAWSVGPLCSLVQAFGAAGPSAPNSLTFDYGDIQDPANTPAPVDLLYTVKVSSDPYVDGLLFTNHVQETEQNTFGETLGQAAIARLTLCEPKLHVRKGVVRTNKAGALFSPTPPAPSGVTFALPGTSGPAFTGTINSSNVLSALHSDLSNVDGCDRVKYAVVIENLGCSSAFDVKISDLVPSCMSSRSNLQVRNGNGVPLAFSGSFFGAGITLADSAGAGALAPFSPTGGNNIAVITFDTQIGCNLPATGCCTNTAKVLNYAGVENGPNHVGAGFSTPFPGAASPFSDAADVCVRPKLNKSIVATSEAHTGTVGGITKLAIGEIATYKLQVTVPQGTSPAMTIADTLPAGMVWLSGGCFAAATPQLIVPSLGIALSGPTLTLNAGNVINPVNSPAQTLTITCRALVLNQPVNIAPASRPNSFTVRIKPKTQPAVVFTSNVVLAEIVEPAGKVTKKELPSATPGTTIYELGYTNTGSATAFDLNFLDNLPSPLTVSGLVAVSPSTCSVLPAPPTQVKVRCPSLPVGGTVKVRFTVKGVPRCKPLVNTVNLTYTSLPGPKGTGNVTPGPSGATNGERIYPSAASVTTSSCPDLVITKTHSGNFVAGQIGTYTLTVTNTGTLPSVPPDTVQDTLPAGFLFVSGGGGGWTCTASGQLVTCASGTPIPAGGSSTFTILVTVPCGTQLTENCAKVTTGLELDLSDNSDCDRTDVTPPLPGCTPPPAGMAAWWTLDETAGPVAADRAGAVNNDGIHLQGPTPTPGKVAGALCFDGIDDRVEVQDDPEIDVGTGDFSIDAWVRTSSTSGIITLVDKRDFAPFARGYTFFLINGQLFLQMATGIGSSFCSTSPSDGCTNFGVAGSPSIADGLWHHVAVTVDRDDTQGGVFYIDGSPVPGTFNPALRPQSLDNGANGRIAMHAQGGSFLKGCLDEIEIFKRELTAAEIKAIFAAGSAGKCKCSNEPCTSYLSPGSFPSGLAVEDFEKGNVPAQQSKVCNSPVSASGDSTGCFAPGAIKPGASFQFAGGGSGDLLLLGTGFTDNLATAPSKMLSAGGDNIRMVFAPPVTAVSFRLLGPSTGFVTVKTPLGDQTFSAQGFAGLCCRAPVSEVLYQPFASHSLLDGVDDVKFGVVSSCP